MVDHRHGDVQRIVEGDIQERPAHSRDRQSVDLCRFAGVEDALSDDDLLVTARPPRAHGFSTTLDRSGEWQTPQERGADVGQSAVLGEVVHVCPREDPQPRCMTTEPFRIEIDEVPG